MTGDDHTRLAVRAPFDDSLTWYVPDVNFNINPTHRQNYGCAVNPIPYGCLTCPLPECRYVAIKEDARLCEGSGIRIENTSATRGPGLFECPECARPDVKVKRLPRIMGVYRYIARNHYPRESVPA